MADITNPEAIKFCNERVRPVADLYAQLYWFAKAVREEWIASDMGTLIPSTADVVVDGSAVDGRHAISGAMVNGLVTTVGAFLADLEASGNLKLNALHQIAVNPVR